MYQMSHLYLLRKKEVIIFQVTHITLSDIKSFFDSHNLHNSYNLYNSDNFNNSYKLHKPYNLHNSLTYITHIKIYRAISILKKRKNIFL